MRSNCFDLDSGLKDEFRSCCLIQLTYVYFSKNLICQKEGIFSRGIEGALAREGLDVLRISLYVEENGELMRVNIE